MAVSWTLKDASGANLSHQPSAGDPLALNFNTQGYPYYSTYTTEIVYMAVAETIDGDPVSIVLSPDTSGYVLDETESDPTKDPARHDGALTWTNSGTTTTLTFTVPTSVNTSWDWIFGDLTPPVALKMKARIKRISA